MKPGDGNGEAKKETVKNATEVAFNDQQGVSAGAFVDAAWETQTRTKERIEDVAVSCAWGI